MTHVWAYLPEESGQPLQILGEVPEGGDADRFARLRLTRDPKRARRWSKLLSRGMRPR